MKRPGPILVSHLFPEIRQALLTLLTGLTPEEWEEPTVCASWSVKDVATHLLAGDVGILSRSRDGYTTGESPGERYEEFVAFINGLNRSWVEATRRLSPRLLCDMLNSTGPQVEEYFASLDPHATGPPVAWAGSAPAPVWLDLAREYTERWHHQQQIRDAVDSPGLKEPRFFAPVLDAFVRALPHTFRDISAPEATTLHYSVRGDSGGDWFLVKGADQWDLYLEADSKPAAQVVLDEDDAWRLLTRGIRAEEVRAQVTTEGQEQFVSRMLEMISVIA